MPPARRSTTSKSTARTGSRSTARASKTSARASKTSARASKTSARASQTTARATKAVRARAASTSAATRREVEQSITRFEKRLDDANDALATLGKNLGRGAQSSYKEVTAAMRALRRDAAKTNKQALKDFDKLRAALTPSNASGGSRTTRSSSRGTARASSGRSTASKSAASRSSVLSRSTGSRSTGSRSTGSRATSSRSTSSRSRAKKS